MSWKNLPKEVVSKPGHALIPNWIARTNHVPPLARLVLLALASHAGEKLECFIRRSVLVEEIGISDSSVRRSLKWLAENDYIEVKHRFADNGQQRSSEFRLTFPVTLYGRLIMPGGGPDEPDDGPDDGPDDLGADSAEDWGGLTEHPNEESNDGVFSENTLGSSDRTPQGVLGEHHKKNPLRNTSLKTGVVGSAVNPPAPEPENPSPVATPPPSRESSEYPEHIVKAGYWPTGDVMEMTQAIKGRANLLASIARFRTWLKRQSPRTVADRDWVDDRWITWIKNDAAELDMKYEAQLDVTRMQVLGQAAQPKQKKFNPNAVAE